MCRALCAAGLGRGGVGPIDFFLLPELCHESQSLDFTEFSLSFCIQRAEQLSDTLKKIATSQKFTNFDLFYVDFDFQESKYRSVWVPTQDKRSSCASEPPHPHPQQGVSTPAGGRWSRVSTLPPKPRRHGRPDTPTALGIEER